MIYPCITDQKSFITAFKDSFIIYKNNFKHLLISLGLFYLFFEIPQTIIQFLMNSTEIEVLSIKYLSRIVGLYNIAINLLVYPILTLILTRIYNTSGLATNTQNDNVKGE